MTDSERRMARYILNFRGIEKQRRILQEECAELIQAVSKLERYGETEKYTYNFVEELADVSILIEQMKMAFDWFERALFVKIIDEKLIREIDRIAKERGNTD